MWRVFNKDGAEKKSPVSAIRPLARLQASAGTAVPSTAFTNITLGTVQIDTDGLTGTANAITVKKAGNYRISGGVAYPSGAAGHRQVALLVNGVIISQGLANALSGYSTFPETERTITLNAGDVVTLQGWQDTGASITTTVNYNTFLEVEYVDGAVVTYVGVPGSLIGQEVAYVETPTALSVTALTEGTAQTFLTAPAFAADGVSDYLIEFFCPRMDTPAVAGNQVAAWLFVDGVSAGALIEVLTPTAAIAGSPALGKVKIKPTAGNHVCAIKCTVSSGSGLMNAGPGTPGNWRPASLRITRAS